MMFFSANTFYFYKTKEYVIYSGTINIKRPRELHYAYKFIVHANYDPVTLVNDIGLIKVSLYENLFDSEAVI